MPNGIDVALIEQIAETEPSNALEYVQDIYKGRRPIDPWRFRAAIAALPFESPKLAVTTLIANGDDFAAMLDRAIERSATVRMIEAKPIAREEG